MTPVERIELEVAEIKRLIKLQEETLRDAIRRLETAQVEEALETPPGAEKDPKS